MIMGKTQTENFSIGTGEVQMFQTNQLHNNDVMNVNG